jgi:hypothetical protein
MLAIILALSTTFIHNSAAAVSSTPQRMIAPVHLDISRADFLQAVETHFG